jgi:hypothetical protein
MIESNGYDVITPNKIKQKKTENNCKEQQENKIWGLFTYFGKEVRCITKIFNNYNERTAFRARNAIGKLLKPTKEMNAYENSGMYKLKCLT